MLLLRGNILNYYEKYLSQKVVVEYVVTNNWSKIIVQGEYVSVNLLKTNKIEKYRNKSA